MYNLINIKNLKNKSMLACFVYITLVLPSTSCMKKQADFVTIDTRNLVFRITSKQELLFSKIVIHNCGSNERISMPLNVKSDQLELPFSFFPSLPVKANSLYEFEVYSNSCRITGSFVILDLFDQKYSDVVSTNSSNAYYIGLRNYVFDYY